MKGLSALLIFVFLQLSTLGQYKVENTLGFKLGINRSTLTGNNNNRRKGINVELTEESKIAHSITTYLGSIGFTSEGAIKEGFQRVATPVILASYFPQGQIPQYVYGDFEREIKLNYLSTISLIEVTPTLENKFFIKPYFAGGIFLNYLLSAKEVINGASMVYLDSGRTQLLNNSSNTINETTNVKSGFHKFNLGVLGFLGVSFRFGKSKLFIEGGGNYGILNINKSSENKSTRTTSLLARIGCSFNVKTFPLPWFRSSNE